MPLSETEAAQAVRRYNEMADQIAKSNETFRRLVGRSVVNQVLTSAQTTKMLQGVAESFAAQVRETNAHMAALESVGRANGEAARQLVDTFEAFSKRIPRLIPDYSLLFRDLAQTKSAMEAFNRLVSDAAAPLRNLQVTTLLQVSDLAPTLGRAREAAWQAATDLKIEPVREFVTALDDAERVLLESEAEERRRGNPILLVATIGVLIALLANQEEVLSTLFFDAATISHGLAQVWEYAVVVLFVILVGLRRPPD
jgi:hypothetical protein